MSPRPCECVDPDVLSCACSLEDSDTIDFSGAGTEGDPFTGEVIVDPDGANQLESNVNGLFIDVRQPACRVYITENVEVTAGPAAAVAFAHEYRDADNMHSNSINNTRITFPKDGWVIFEAGAYYAVDATGGRGVNIRLNGTTTISGDYRNAVDSGAGTLMHLYGFYYVSAGDYAEMMVVTSHTVDLEAHGDYSAVFGAAYILAN